MRAVWHRSGVHAQSLEPARMCGLCLVEHEAGGTVYHLMLIHYLHIGTVVRGIPGEVHIIIYRGHIAAVA